MAGWPSRIVFLLKATQAAVTNFAPMFHAGLDRIAGLVILRGVKISDTPSPAERREALDPASRLRAWALRELRLPPEHVIMCGGDPDRATPWSEGALRAARLAEQVNAEVMLNLTGGRAATTFGALLAWPREAQPPHVYHVSGEPLQAWMIEKDGSGLHETPLPAAAHLDLATRLYINGVEEPRDSGREGIEAAFLKERHLAMSVFDDTMTSSGFGAIRTINARLARWQAGAPAQMPLTDGEHSAFGRFLRCAPLPDCILEPHALRLGSEASLRYFKGGWLEAYVYNLVMDELGNDPANCVGCNLRLAYQQSNADLGEIDVFLMKRDQLHIIEVKAYTGTGKGVLDGAISKLSSIKRQLIGQQGQGWLVVPLLNDHSLEKGDYIRRAKEAGISLLNGRNAMNRLRQDLKRLP